MVKLLREKKYFYLTLAEEIAVAEEFVGNFIGSFEPGLVESASWQAEILVQFKDIASGSKLDFLRVHQLT